MLRPYENAPYFDFGEHIVILMWYSKWNILVVDDEPDVLQLSKLVMKDIEIDGIPIRVHTASSKEEAITLLRENFTEESAIGTLAVAIIDVVMENDAAGLELCDFICNTMKNPITQLYIRTGQPGAAPERSVIDEYNISGYFTKVEATEDKLYSIVKSGIRQFQFAEYSMMTMGLLNGAVAGFVGGQMQISQVLNDGLGAMAANRNSEHSAMVVMIGDDTVMEIGLTRAEAEAKLAEIQAGGNMRSLTDDIQYGAIGNNTAVIIDATPYSPAIQFVGGVDSMPPNDMIVIQHALAMRSVGILWQHAGNRVPQ